jgi:toxin ParE1/3/4
VRIRYTSPAATDLDGILEYLTLHSPPGARHVQARLKSVEKLLAQFPLSGSPTRLSWLRRMTTALTHI